VTKRERGQVVCRQCGKRRVEELREDWATPVCFACLPPARRIDKTPKDSHNTDGPEESNDE